MEEEWPPTVSCPRCGRADCSELECVRAEAEPVGECLLPWEQSSRPWPARLWQTTLATSLEVERTFGRLPLGQLAPALVFAVLAELLAIGSLLLVAVPLLTLVPVFGPLLWHWIAMSGGGVWALLITTAFMVGVHVLWGVCIELGALGSATPPQVVSGVRFGLYACGWDLLTSPAGLLLSLITRGTQRGFQPLVVAARAPRGALRAYTQRCRGFTPAIERRGTYLAVGAFLGLMLVLLGLATVWLLRALLSGT